MSLKKLSELRHTLSFRLTLIYTVIFSFSSIIVFIVSYLTLISFMRSHAEEAMLDDFHEYAFIYNSRGLSDLKNDILMENKLEVKEGGFIRLINERGEDLLGTDIQEIQSVPLETDILKKLDDDSTPIIKILSIPGYNHKIIVLYGYISPEIAVQIGRSLKHEEIFLDGFKDSFMAIIGIFALFAVGIGWFMARRAISGVQEVTSTAREISGGDFDKRVMVKGMGTEIDDLAETFNGMLDQIQLLLIGMREMTDNIAHDLRSPLARIRGTAEMALLSGASTLEYENMAVGTIEDCDRLLSMINTMLEISEAESGAARLRLERLDAAEIIKEAVELFGPLAEESSVTLEMQECPRCMIPGDRQKLQRLFSNLIDNSIKYTPEGGSVLISLLCGQKEAVISVTDTGQGIGQADIDRIFDRFYRGDKSRSKPGIGLGLPLARAIARSHGGDISVSSQAGAGSTFTVTLPISPQ